MMDNFKAVERGGLQSRKRIKAKLCGVCVWVAGCVCYGWGVRGGVWAVGRAWRCTTFCLNSGTLAEGGEM